jgi:hypothetical protein
MRSAFSRFGLFRSCYSHSEEENEEKKSAAALCFLDENVQNDPLHIDQSHSDRVESHVDLEAASNVDAQGASSQPTEDFFDEFVDDSHVIHNYFMKLDVNGCGHISSDQILSVLKHLRNKSGPCEDFISLVESLKSSEPAASIDLNTFQELVNRIPRIRGRRVHWARAMKLETVLARHLKAGDLFDELSAVKDMKAEELQGVLNSFCKDATRIITEEWERLSQLSSSVDDQRPASINTKFSGELTGRAGNILASRHVLENLIGNPDPFILAGILREHLSSASSPYYYMGAADGLVTTDVLEFARMLGSDNEYEKDKSGQVIGRAPLFLEEVAKGLHVNGMSKAKLEGPSDAELRQLEEQFRCLRSSFADTMEGRQGLFPGEPGYTEHLLDVLVTASSPEDAARWLAQQGSQLALARGKRAQAGGEADKVSPRPEGAGVGFDQGTENTFSSASSSSSCSSSSSSSSSCDLADLVFVVPPAPRHHSLLLTALLPCGFLTLPERKREQLREQLERVCCAGDCAVAVELVNPRSYTYCEQAAPRPLPAKATA